VKKWFHAVCHTRKSKKTEGSLWETVFFVSGFFCLLIFMLRLILLLDFQKSKRISRQISRQKNKKPCGEGKKERLVVI